MVAPSKPDERSVRRGPSGVVINAAVPAIELHDGVVRVRRSGGREAERQYADYKHKSFHDQPLVVPLPCRPQSSAKITQLTTVALRSTVEHGEISL